MLLVTKVHLPNKNKFQIHVIVIERVTSSISVDITLLSFDILVPALV